MLLLQVVSCYYLIRTYTIKSHLPAVLLLYHELSTMTDNEGKENNRILTDDDGISSPGPVDGVGGGGTSRFPLVFVSSSDDHPPHRQEPALLIEEYENMHLIEWKSSGERDYVESHRVSRRRKRAMIGTTTSSSSSSSGSTPPSNNRKDAATSCLPAEAGAKDTTKRRSPTAQDDDDDDDDEVQVLLTILPPSPANKPKVNISRHAVTPLPTSTSTSTSSMTTTITPATTTAPICTPYTTMNNATSSEELSTKAATTTTIPESSSVGTSSCDRSSDLGSKSISNEDHMALNRTLWASSRKTTVSIANDCVLEQETGASTSDSIAGGVLSKSSSPTPSSPSSSTLTAHTTVLHKFSSRSSAYLQSLAEICYSILWDVRWRVAGIRQERLLSWGRGDDLSAVHALARRYLPPSRSPPRRSSCQCLLCYQPEQQPNTAGSSEDGIHHIADEGENKASNTGGGPSAYEGGEEDTPAASVVTDDSTIISEEEEAYDRSLNLYARMYSRKGPWFRVDDLFKYYIPKLPDRINDSEPPSLHPPSPVKPTSPSKFFLPNSAKNSNTKKRKSSSQTIDSFIDQDHVNRQLEAVGTLLQDLKQLFAMGLLRSFDSEQECGQTIGQVQKYGLLRQEEQRSVLTKLGGAKKQQQSQPQSRRSNDNNSTENLIWKQMCQQQSILAQATTNTTSSDDNNKPMTTVLLPVTKHVDQALISSWATSVVLRASLVDYIPQGLLRSITTPVQQILHQLVKEVLGQQQQQHKQTTRNGSGGIAIISSLMCLRLREAPLKSLRRSCRLYLCATSGPGEMRGDTGTNGWKSLPNESITCSMIQESRNGASSILPTNVVAPPGSQNWHHTIYPGRDYRFKLMSCLFQRAHQPLILKTESDEASSDLVKALTEDEIRRVQVFSSVFSFELWELSVELRANVDYLMEANDLSLYNERKRAREEEDARNGQMNDPDESSTEEEDSPAEDADHKASAGQHDIESTLDFLDVLRLSGRKTILRRFASTMTENASMYELEQRVESDVECLLGCRGPSVALKKGTLKNDCEKVLGVMGIIAASILSLRNETASQEEVTSISNRPWLRHMWWEGCIAYCLWDIIPMFERRGFYHLATKALEILLFGKFQPRSDVCQVIPKTLVAGNEEMFLARAYLSRRARGKAFERLVIDYTHILRQTQKEAALIGASTIVGKKKRKRKSQNDIPLTATTSPSTNDLTAQLCEELLQACLSTGQITFCAARTLARRLKQPLSETLSNLDVYEIKQLGHRVSPDDKSGAESRPEQSVQNRNVSKKYSDWTPITDYAVANAMATDRNSVGGRCSFVGFEDGQETSRNFGTLNVEELALEYYNTGRLPIQQRDHSPTVRGGWVGWHDEGGKLRSLFRILSSTTVLGTDWGCPYNLEGSTTRTFQNATIHLTPYQGAPFDLHVGAEHNGSSSDTRLGFYERRRVVIDKFLARLGELNPLEVADLVHRSIVARLQYASEAKQNEDPTLERDAHQARTLSAVAAGFGGKMLAAMCRCLFFDYRHYSGGMPDLTLFRAIYEQDDDNKAESLVDLGSWIGEAFSSEQLSEAEAKSVASMFEDQDDEFLGCGKVGDSGHRNTRGGRNRTTSRRPEERKRKPEIKIPDKLILQHERRNVRVECMLVEVKSQNDRLDPRQEDWLNVLNRYGNVRVCKFGVKRNSKA